MIHDWGEVVTR